MKKYRKTKFKRKLKVYKQELGELAKFFVASGILSALGIMVILSYKAEPVDAEVLLTTKHVYSNITGIVPNHLPAIEDHKGLVLKQVGCDLTFWSNKDGGHWETPPESYVQNIKNYDCNSQKWLSRLAHYESSYNPNAKNGYFEGYYQIGSGDTRQFCKDNNRNSSDEDCALYLVSWLDQMPLMFESHYRNKNSFEDLAKFLRSDVVKNMDFGAVPSGNVNDLITMITLVRAAKKELYFLIKGSK